MKKTLLLLFFTAISFAQTGILTPVDRLKIKTPQELSSNTQVITRGTTTGETGYVLKSDLTDVLKYATASAFPLTGVVGKLYYAIDTDLYYKWDGATYEEFGAGGGSGSATIVTKTKAEIDTLMSGNDLVPLTVYEITGVDTALYGGSTIYLQAITNNTLAVDGVGKFYNPKYNQAVSGFDVWTSSGTYAIGDKVHWGGKTWTNVNGNVGASTNIFTLNAEWSVIAFNSTDYNVVYDSIKYDYDNDVIIYRNEQNSNIVSASFNNIQDNWTYNPIKVFMWGNLFDPILYVGIGTQKINNSYNENINFRGAYQTHILFENNSFQTNVLFENESFQYRLNFNNGSYQTNLIFNNSSFQSDLNFSNNSNQNTLNFDNGSYQTNLDFENSSNQISVTFDNLSGQEKLSLKNNSFQNNFTEISGLLQINVDFNNYRFNRVSSPMIANEAGLVFQGDLPISTTATKMIVKEDNQLKEMDIPGGGSGSTNLSATYAPTTVTIVSSSGTDATVTAVSDTQAGVVTTTQKADWDAKQTEAQVQAIADAKVSDTAYNATSWNGVTDKAPAQNALRDKFVSLESDIQSSLALKANAPTFDNTQPTIALISDAGDIYYADTIVYPTPTELEKVKGVTSALQPQLNGKQPLATVLTNTTASFTTAQETKLSGIATGATANSSDATLLARANHTGTQPSSTISDFNTATDTRIGLASINALSDVNIISPATDHTLVYDGIGEFRNGLLSTTSLSNFDSATRAQVEAELVAGSNITITPSGSGATRTLTIASTGGSSTQGAYTVLANNTSSTATPTEQVFKNVSEQTYSGKIVVTATTAPSGATNHTYRWQQIGKQVTLVMNINYATSGAAVTSIACELPTDLPTPYLPSSVAGALDVICYGSGTMAGTNQQSVVTPGTVALRLKSISPNVFEAQLQRGSGTYANGYISLTYFAQ